VRHQEPGGQRLEQVVVMAVAAAGLVADLEAVGQALEEPQQFAQGAHPGAVRDLPLLVERAGADVLAVDVEADVEHGYLP
jgi:hypothetical protein